MKKATQIIFFCVVVLLCAAQPAKAALISLDSAYGADTITYDDETNLSWLDVTLSTPYSYSEILVELEVGGEFEGYRLATTDEVSILYVNAGIPSISVGFVSENYDPVKSLMALVGITGHDGNLGTGIPFDYTVGHTATLFSDPDWVTVGGLGVYEENQTARASFAAVPIDNINDKHGSWLVKTSVPEPASVYLLALGIGLLGLFRRRG